MRFLPWSVVCLLWLAGCSTDRSYKITHEQMVNAAIEALIDDANVKRDEIKRSEVQGKGGPITVLTSPYKRTSRVECKVDSTEKNREMPELEIRVLTNDTFYTRHKEWEWRLHEVVNKKLTAKEHGAESRPSSLPMEKPKLPPAVEEKKIDLKTK